MKKLTIIGASGHGKVIADIAKLSGYDEIVFLDDDTSVTSCGGYPVVGKSDSTISGDAVVAIGNGTTRRKIMQAGTGFVTLIHPSAVIAEDVEIGRGTVVMAGVVINPGTKIGEGCIINTTSSVDHDCIVGDYVHVAVGAHLCGTVSVGENTWVGAGSTISNNISICGETMIGAGAVVVKDITEKGTYIGVPAERIDD